jgi:hypothetical protein
MAKYRDELEDHVREHTDLLPDIRSYLRRRMVKMLLFASFRRPQEKTATESK